MPATPLVLPAEVSHDQIDDAARDHGWQLINVRGASGTHPAQLVFAVAGESEPAAYLQLVEDTRLGVAYLCAEGPQAEQVLALAGDSLACHRSEERLRLLCDERLAVLRRGLALLALDADAVPDAKELDRLRELLRHPEPLFRAASLTALAYRPLPELREQLERLRDEDEDPALRWQAAQLLSSPPSAAPPVPREPPGTSS